MAYLENNLEEDDQLGQQGVQGQSQAPLVGSGTSNVGGVSQAGVGSGGTGGWTNIQAYLSANPSSPGSANAVREKIGGAFDQEQSKLSTEAQSAKSQADAQTQTKPDLDQAISGGSAAEQMKAFLNSQYSGPTQFNYALGGDTQNYGESLGSREGWQGLLNNVYDKTAGGKMTSGQRSLQQQLDVNNPYLASAQTDLSGKYGQLKNLADETVRDTQDYVGGASGRLRDSQQGAKSAIQSKIKAMEPIISAGATPPVGWNEAKRGPYQDVYNQDLARYNQLLDFLGLAPVAGSKDTTTGGKDLTAGDGYLYPGGDYMPVSKKVY